jgi:hypothetical protein
MSVDYLTEDTIIPEGQKFVCISFLSDKDNKTTLSGIKIRGVFSTYESACEQAKKLQNIDPYFNVFVGETGKWLPFDPNPESENFKDSEYANDQLNKMMKSYMESQEKAKLFHEQRKNELVRQNLLDNIKIRKDNLNELNNKLSSVNDDDKKNLEENINNIENQIKTMEEKQKEVTEQLNVLDIELKKFI